MLPLKAKGGNAAEFSIFLAAHSIHKCERRVIFLLVSYTACLPNGLPLAGGDQSVGGGGGGDRENADAR